MIAWEPMVEEVWDVADLISLMIIMAMGPALACEQVMEEEWVEGAEEEVGSSVFT